MASKLGFKMLVRSLRKRKGEEHIESTISKAGVSEGETVVDFGCGPGDFAAAAARVVGPSGHVYAVDRNPHAREYVEENASTKGLDNLSFIESDGALPLEDGTVDRVIMLDVYHNLKDDAPGVIGEMARVLRPSGTLVVEVDHVPIERAVEGIESASSFLSERTDGDMAMLHRV